MIQNKLLIPLLILLEPVIALSQNANPWSIELARSLSRDIFELNGVPYLKPLVVAINSTSNARFFSSARVPRHVRKPYFKFGIQGMLGFVRDDMKSYVPAFPMEEFTLSRIDDYADVDIINQKIVIQDTVGLINYLFKTVLYNGVQKGSLVPPKTASTVLGYQNTKLWLNNDTLKNLVKEHPLYPFLPQNMKDTVLNAVGGIPGFYSFPPGGNFSTLFAFVPQLEIGAIYNTEALIRFVPPVKLSNEIGKFAFWGFGLKHSISNYFYKSAPESKEGLTNSDPLMPEEALRPPFDLAVQAVYQGTHLENTVGVTNSELKADATIWDFNIQGSWSLNNIVEFFSGFSYELINITSDFKYYLPVETQYFLGLLDRIIDDQGRYIILPPDPPRFPGDTKPQVSNIRISDSNFKWIIGARKEIGPVALFFDYSISKFDIFSGGIEYRF